MERRDFFKYSLNAGVIAGLASNGVANATSKNSNSLLNFVSVGDFGATGDGSIQTAEIQDALDNCAIVYVPNGVYKVRDLSLNNKHNIIFESHDAIFEGETLSDNIFSSSSLLSRIKIEGGSFRKCLNVFYHTGNSSVSNSEFNYMHIHDCTNGFNISSSVSNNWFSCLIGTDSSQNNIEIGILFASTGSGQTNINNIISCAFLHFSKNAIFYADTSIVKKKNIIDNCWFEDGSSGALYIGGTSSGFTIENSYFENNNSIEPDIHIQQSVGHANLGIRINNCEFNTSGVMQSERIKANGNAQFSASDNTAMLRNGQNFVRLENSSYTHTLLNRNYLNAVGGGLYSDRLFSKSGTQQVSWDIFVGSGFVTDDEHPLEFFDGVKVQNVEGFSTGQSTPSVREGNFFTVESSSSISNLLQGRVGQKVTILANKNVSFLNGMNMKLAGNINFDMHINDTLTVFMFNQDVWTEIGRSINS